MTGKRPQQDTSGNITVDGDIYLGGRSLVNAIGTTDFRQFAAAGSLLDNIPARIHPAEVLLRQSVWWIDAAHSSASGQTITNLGWGGSALNAQAGSTSGSDTNDPKFLDFDGTPYVYLPGVTGNYMTVPDENALDITGDIDIRVRVALDDWGSSATLLAKWNDAGGGSQASYLFQTLGGYLRLWFNNSTISINRDSTVSAQLAAGATKWVRVVLDVDNGASGHDAKFYTSDDGVTWTQLGTTVTNSGVQTIRATTTPLELGTHNAGATSPVASKIYRAIVKNGIDGPSVLDVDASVITSGSATSFTACTGQTVTINRSTTGRKSVAVVHPCWLFGSDDFMQVSDNDLLDFGALDSFTVIWIGRQWNAPGTAALLNKKPDLTYSAGWSMFTDSGNDGFFFADGTAGPSPTVAPTLGAVGVIGGVRDVSIDKLTLYKNAVAGTPVTDNSTGTLASSSPLRVGSVATSYSDMEFVAAAVFRRVLTSTEITTLTNYFQGRAA